MSSVVVASTNPVKIEAARAGFAALFPSEAFTFDGVSVPSGVSAQPMSDAETLQGALNRAARARALHPAVTYTVGIEGGIDVYRDNLLVFAWVVVLGSSGRAGKSRTAAFVLPDEVSALVRQGIELGEADDQVFGRSNSKQDNGAVGLLTGDVITRTLYYEQAVILALLPFKNPSLTFGQDWVE
jgi:inosine/xanthosine triphosphatase